MSAESPIGVIGSALIIVALSFNPALAQSANPLLVDTSWLAERLSDANLLLLHVGSKPDYDAEHIRGARFITDFEVVAGMYDLPPAEALRAKFASLGISDDSRIVVYAGRNGELPSATRIIFTLDYIGLGERTSLLNGGLPAWKRASREVTTAVPRITAGKLTERPVRNIVADAELVKSVPRRPGHKLVDGRAPVYYAGIEATHDKSGHVPGAVNIPFSNVPGTDLMIDRERVAEMFRNAGIVSGDTVVAYCHIGQQATVVVFAARLLGHSALLYDGSFHDWAMNDRGPVEK